MFERFTREAREAVVGAQAAARRLNHRRIGTEHLLLSLLAGGAAADVLAEHGVTAQRVEAAIARHVGNAPGMLGPADAAALKVIGIDLDEVRAHLEENFGPEPFAQRTTPEPPRRRFGLRRSRRDDGAPPTGHIPFSPRAKKVLELALREAIRLKHREIRWEHILLGLIREGEGLAALILAEADLDLKALRADLEERMAPRAA